MTHAPWVRTEGTGECALHIGTAVRNLIGGRGHRRLDTRSSAMAAAYQLQQAFTSICPHLKYTRHCPIPAREVTAEIVNTRFIPVGLVIINRALNADQFSVGERRLWMQLERCLPALSYPLGVDWVTSKQGVHFFNSLADACEKSTQTS